MPELVRSGVRLRYRATMHVIPGFGQLRAFWHVNVTGPIIAELLGANVTA